jgi:hypothetical protein
VSAEHRGTKTAGTESLRISPGLERLAKKLLLVESSRTGGRLTKTAGLTWNTFVTKRADLSPADEAFRAVHGELWDGLKTFPLDVDVQTAENSNDLVLVVSCVGNDVLTTTWRDAPDDLDIDWMQTELLTRMQQDWSAAGWDDKRGAE